MEQPLEPAADPPEPSDVAPAAADGGAPGPAGVAVAAAGSSAPMDGSAVLVLDEFLARIAVDRLGGGVRPLRHYLAAFPEHETLIAGEYLALTGAASGNDERTSTPRGPGAPAGPGWPLGPDRSHGAAGGGGGGAAGGQDDVLLGGYRVLAELGRGGQAVVHLAEDPRLGRRVALKVVPPSLLPGSASRRLQREAEVTSQLEHPGICPVYEVGSSDAGSWIAMRYVEGRTLAAVLAEREAQGIQVDPMEDVALVESVARAVDAAHRVGVIHRDVKPANIMVQPDGAPVMLDFGLAHREYDGASLTRSGLAPGTPAYMAPEQLAGEPLDARADVWALGVVLFECLTGRRPFQAPTHSALAVAIEREPLPDPRRLRRGLSRDLVKVLQVALSKPREERYASARDLADDLQRLRERRPVAARPAGPLARLSRWASRNPLVAASLALVLLVLSAATIVSRSLLGETRQALAERTEALSQKNAALGEREAALGEKDAALVALQVALDDEATALAQVTRLADLRTAQQLLDGEPLLWPAVPAKAADMVAWLAGADDLLARRGDHARLRGQVQARLAAQAAADAAHDTAGVGGQAAPDVSLRARWDRDTDLWLAEQLDLLAASLDELDGRCERVARRLERARTVVAETLESPDQAWAQARELVAADPRFEGFDLLPQLGLVPLGPDPSSGLLECAVFGTGEVPERDDGGRLQLGEGSAIVLVLIPGGRVRAGAAAPYGDQDPGEPHVDVRARPQDGPVVSVRLDPYFLGKHELTQGQWLRHTGSNPSTYVPGKPWVDAERPLMHPVETVTWHDARRVLGQLGLSLPTEVQWERGARGGTTSDWWTGDELRSIDGACNLGDLTSVRGGGDPEWEHEPWLEDGWSVHAPVDAHAANPFGLHGVIGNVSEWCEDLWQHWGLNPPRDGDGLSVGIAEAPVYRGGNYAQDARSARSATRNGLPGHMRIFNLGARAARAVEREPQGG